MKLKKGFEIVNVAGDYMLVPVDDQIDIFNGTVILNEVSAFMLNKLKHGVDKKELIRLLMDEYGIDSLVAKTDVEEAIKKMLKIGMIDEEHK